MNLLLNYFLALSLLQVFIFPINHLLPSRLHAQFFKIRFNPHPAVYNASTNKEKHTLFDLVFTCDSLSDDSGINDNLI